MSFVDAIWKRLRGAAETTVMQEIRAGGVVSVTGAELMSLVHRARTFVAAAGLKRGDRCALLAPNSIRWAALDLALMAEGIIVVPLYARQAPAELMGVMRDCSPARICCSDHTLADAITQIWPDAPPVSLLEDVFSADAAPTRDPLALSDADPVTIIYTSGTSGEPKGVVLNAGNVTFMLSRTNARLDQLMGKRDAPERVFHYLPFCFAGSWIFLLTCLGRNNLLSLSTDLARLGEEMRLAAPNLVLNVPTLLERVRSRIEEQVGRQGGPAAFLFARAKAAGLRRHRGNTRGFDRFWLGLAKGLLFPTIRKSVGPNLRALICGSAPLAVETQLFFSLLGIPVLQVYGLTETTAVCTLDDPRQVESGYVGPAIPGIEMKLGERDEILVRGPNIFPGYWQRPEATAQVLRDGWFHTGDQGGKNARGNWRITGRLKNLILLSSGHNIAPEPLEDDLARHLPGEPQVMLVGNDRSFLALIVAGGAANGLGPERVQAAIDAVNARQPHYRQIRAFRVVAEPFTAENGLLTANGKLRREAIVGRHREEIEHMYRGKER